jgi:hypothetical protein
MKAELIWRSKQKSTENKHRHYMEMTASQLKITKQILYGDDSKVNCR